MSSARSQLSDGDPIRSVAIIGANGFVGGALRAHFQGEGLEVNAFSAPRLQTLLRDDPTAIVAEATAHPAVADWAFTLRSFDVVINAAGLALPDARASDDLYGANALLPVMLLEASRRAGIRRFVHMSSAAVQGRIAVLDETMMHRPFSPYSRSKALAEAALLDCIRTEEGEWPDLVIVRATSVQGPERPTTQTLRRIARSRISSVARPGTQMSAVSSIGGLCRFVAFVSAFRGEVRSVVLQPPEALTVAGVLRAAGGRDPIRLPRALCRTLILLGFAGSAVVPGLAGTVRRVEVMWFGQQVDAAWAREAGFQAKPGLHEVLSNASSFQGGAKRDD